MTDHWAKAVEAALATFPLATGLGYRYVGDHSEEWIDEDGLSRDLATALRAALPHLVEAVLEECELSGIPLTRAYIVSAAKEIAGGDPC